VSFNRTAERGLFNQMSGSLDRVCSCFGEMGATHVPGENPQFARVRVAYAPQRIGP
jgi:hypothetical protein